MFDYIALLFRTNLSPDVKPYVDTYIYRHIFIVYEVKDDGSMRILKKPAESSLCLPQLQFALASERTRASTLEARHEHPHPTPLERRKRAGLTD